MAQETSTFELIAKVAFESNLEAAKETTSQLAKQDNLVNELTAHQKELETQIKKTSDPAVIQKLNKELEKSEKVLTEQQRTIQAEFKKTAAAIEKEIGGIDFGKFKKLFSGAELGELDKRILAASSEMRQLAIATDELKNKLSTLDNGSAEFRELNEVIQVSESTLREYATAADLAGTSFRRVGATFEEVYGEIQPLNTQIGELEDRMYQLALSGEKNTEEYKALETELIKYKKTIREVDDSIDASVETSRGLKFIVDGTQAIAAAFEIGAGAAALFGVEQEELEKVQTKLLAVMALANGLEQLSTLLKKESIIVQLGQAAATKAATVAQAAYTAVVGTSAGALKAFRIALAATGIGLLVVAIGALVANWDKLTKSISGASDEQKRFADINKQAINGASGEISRLRVLKAIVEDTTKSQKERNNAVLALKKEFPDYFSKLDNEKIKNGEVAGTYDLVTAAIIRRAKSTAAQSKITELVAEELELERQKQIAIKDGADREANAKDEISKKDQALIRSKKEAQNEIEQETIKTVEGLNSQIRGIRKTIDFYTQFVEIAKTVPDPPKIEPKEPPKIKLKFDWDVEGAQKELKKLAEATDRIIKEINNLGVKGITKTDKNDLFDPANQPGYIDPKVLSKRNIERIKAEQKEEQKIKDKAREEELQKEKEFLRQELIARAQQISQIIGLEVQKKDRLISLQQERLTEAETNQEDANAVNVKAERDRLQALQQERERALRAQRLIDAGIIAANQAVAISSAITAITKSSTLGPAAVAANVIAIIGGLAAVGIAVSNAISDIPEFYQGGYTGDGNPKERSTVLGKRPYIYHKGEFVFDHEKTAQHRQLFEGIHANDLIVQKTQAGYAVVPKRLNVGAIANDRNNVKLFYNQSNDNVESRLASIERLLRDKQTTVSTTMDRKGFALSVEESINQIRLIDKRR